MLQDFIYICLVCHCEWPACHSPGGTAGRNEAISLSVEMRLPRGLKPPRNDMLLLLSTSIKRNQTEPAAKRYRSILVGVHLPHPLPLSNQSHLDGLRSYYGWRGGLKREGASPPLLNTFPLSRIVIFHSKIRCCVRGGLRPACHSLVRRAGGEYRYKPK